MLGRRKAITSDRPGVTRDRISAQVDLFGLQVILMDTGGIQPGDTDDLTSGVRAEALKAVKEADLILFVVDARAGLTATDEEVAAILRESGKPVVPLANKIDSASLAGLESEVYRAGLGEVMPLSAEQGRGLDELIDRIRRELPETSPEEARRAVPITIIGRPNVGKSSLFNRLVHQERALVSPIPGTTRDPVDATFERRGTLYRFVDTAGIKRRARAAEMIEQVSVAKAREALGEAEIVIAMVDASAGVEHQDLALLGLVAEGHKPAVLAANKVDLLQGQGSALEKRLREIRAAVRFSTYVPVVGLSALTGRGVDRLLDSVESLREEIHRRFATGDLNRVLREVLAEKQPPADGGHDVRFYYMTQAGGAPPRFLIYGNGRNVPESYRRFMESRLRRHLGLAASPLILAFRRRKAR
jgi:GTP-binding protein